MSDTLESSIPRILIVDDEQMNRKILQKTFLKIEVEADLAESGQQALDFCQQQLYALIILDILMPHMNGYETLMKIKAETINYDTPIFYLTGMEVDSDLLLKSYKTGAVDFIQKPVDTNILQRKAMYFVNFFLQKEEIKEAKMRAEKLMASRMNMIATITHELRTPIFAMLGMADMLKTQVEDGALKLVEKIESNTENLLDTVNEFLDFSKMDFTSDKLEYEFFSLRKMCEEILTVMSFQYHKEQNVELKLAYDRNISDFVRADRKKIRHILMNLFSNALKFTKEGFVRLELIYLGEKDGKQRVRFLVEDTGVGIPRDKIENIFDAYTQVDNELQHRHVGTGLGLAISTKMVRQLGGELEVTSAEGEGTSFSFEMPMNFGTESDITEVKEVYSFDELLGDTRIKVLIVDDVPDNLFVFKNFLKSDKVELDLSHNSEEAQELLMQNDYDLILLDLNMPGKDGFTLAKEYHQQKPNVGVIVALTAFQLDDKLRIRLKNSGFSGYIMKPVKKEVLYKKIVSIVHNVSDDTESLKISELSPDFGKDTDPMEQKVDFADLDEDFLAYLPTYLQHKHQELEDLRQAFDTGNVETARALCHKILGTSHSFGLIFLDKQISQVQSLIKTDYLGKEKQILKIIDECLFHILELKNQFN